MKFEATRETFEATSSASLSLTNIRGNVEIQVGEEGKIDVQAIKRGHTGDAERTEIHMEQAEDGAVTVETRYDHKNIDRLFSNKRRPCKIDYHVTVPVACNIFVSCVSSDATVEGTRGDLELKTVSGDLTLRDLEGQIRLVTVSGDILNHSVRGELDFESVSGDVHLTECGLSRIAGSSVSGDLNLDEATELAETSVKTVSGNVKLTVPGTAAMTLKLKSMSGSILTSLPEATQRTRRKGRTVVIGEGGPEIFLKSLSGDLIAINADDDAAPTHVHASASDFDEVFPPDIEAALPGQKPNGDDPMAILEQIERGDLTVDEGLEALND